MCMFVFLHLFVLEKIFKESSSGANYKCRGIPFEEILTCNLINFAHAQMFMAQR